MPASSRTGSACGRPCWPARSASPRDCWCRGCLPALPALYASAALIGASHMFYNVSAQNLVGSLGGTEERTRNFSNYALAMAIGSFLGPLAAGFSIDHVGHATSYLYVAGLPLVPAVIMASARKVGPRAAAEDRGRAGGHFDEPARQPGAAPHADRERGGGDGAGSVPVLHADLRPFGRAVGLRDRRGARDVRHRGLRGAHLAAGAGEALGARTRCSTCRCTFRPRPSCCCRCSAARLALAAIALVLGLGMGCAQPVTLMLIFSRAPEGRSGEALGMRVTINQFTHIVVPRDIRHHRLRLRRRAGFHRQLADPGGRRVVEPRARRNRQRLTGLTRLKLVIKPTWCYSG